MARALTEAEIQAARTNTAEDRHTVKTLRTALVVAKAAEEAGPEVDPSSTDPDFREHFRSKAESVTSEELQGFLAKLLASEWDAPGTISKRTVSAVADMDRRDAQRLVALCRFRWAVGSSGPRAAVEGIRGPVTR